MKLDDFPNFQLLNESDRHWLWTTAKQEELPPGHILIQEGQPVKSIYFLLDGTLIVSVSQQYHTGADQKLAQISLGQMIGEMSFLDNHPPSATIKAQETSLVLSLSKQQLGSKLEQDGDFAARFYQMVSLKLSQQLRELSDLLTTNQRLLSPPLRKVFLVFTVLNDSDLDWIIANGILEQATPGTVLIAEGKSVESVYILLEGKLTVFIAEREIAKLLKGEILGEMSFVETGVASASVKVIENSFVLALPRKKLTTQLQQNRQFAARFYRAIAVVLANRWRDTVFLLGLGKQSDESTQLSSADFEDEDEIDLDVLDSAAISVARFNWMLERLS